MRDERVNFMTQTINHGQIANVSANGDVNIFYPKTFSKNVYINSNKDTLESFIGAASKITLIDTVYPVGSIYMSVNSTNPSGFIGGTWVSWGSGRVPVGVSTDTEFNTAEKTGGEKSHTLTGAESGQKNLGNITSGNQSAGHTHGFTTGGMSANASHTHNIGNEGGATYGSGSVYHLSPGYTATAWVPIANNPYPTKALATNTDHTHSGTTGGISANHTHTITISASNATNAHNNLQPYITCYMFKRTA